MTQRGLGFILYETIAFLLWMMRVDENRNPVEEMRFNMEEQQTDKSELQQNKQQEKRQEDEVMEPEKPSRRVSVRNLIEFILRNGNIDSTTRQGADVNAMQEGAKLHRKFQSRGGSNYKPEVPLSVTMDIDCAMLTVEGRADGVITGALKGKKLPQYMQEAMERMQEEGREIVTIDEIKCMYRGVLGYEEPEALHLAQAKCYAYIYARQHGLSNIIVQITYVQIMFEKVKQFWYDFSFVELEKWFFDVVFQYSRFLEFEIEHSRKVRETAKEAVFPFAYRKGQRDLTAMVYSSMKRGEHLFCQAPTGVGKTISTVFPAVKAIGEGLADKIFYLTAKTITRTVAEESLALLRAEGLTLSSVTISAKDKLCILEERNCNPGVCERARGHYDRINECLYELLSNETTITRELIEVYAESYKVCPYELSLDVSLWVDAVICDYNYLFDPKVQLKRFFSEQAGKGEYLFLIDEAHNLVERGRSMYSAVLSKEAVLSTRKLLKGIPEPVYKDEGALAVRSLNQMNKHLLQYKAQLDEELLSGANYQRISNCDELYVSLLRFVSGMEKVLEKTTDFDGYEEVMEFYFDVHHFLNMYEKLSEDYVIYTEPEGAKSIKLHLFCVNPGRLLDEVLNKGRSAIFFSATLLPVNYYKELLTGHREDHAVYIPSPFPRENRFLAITSGVTSKYKSRSYEQYERMVDYMKAAAVKPGNYMAFFSSYKLMQDVYDVALERGLSKGRRLLIQESDMTEEEREQFLSEFQKKEEQPLIAFCILGGIFSEGIDLKEDQLIGAFVVGNGLPQVCIERDILNQYFKEQGFDGFAYAYIYPGMNKVLQAAGRVIRTSEDEGIILLMDDRFRYQEYRSLFPQEWEDCKNVGLNNVKQEIENFWEERNKKQ